MRPRNGLRKELAAVCALAVATVLFSPLPVYADGVSALTAVGWARQIHMWVGNALIGIAEGVPIGLVFRSQLRRTIPSMILANYVSAWLAFVLLRSFGEQAFSRLLGDEPLYALPGVVRLLVCAALVETLVVEWPFCLWAMKPGKRRLAKLVGACLLAQVASYAVLIPFYSSSSVFNLYTDFRADRSLISEAPASTVVYYLSPEGDSVYRINLNGTGLATACQIESFQQAQDLFFRRTRDQRGWDLCRSYYSGEGPQKESVLLKNLPVRAGGWRWLGEGDAEEDTLPSK